MAHIEQNTDGVIDSAISNSKEIAELFDENSIALYHAVSLVRTSLASDQDIFLSEFFHIGLLNKIVKRNPEVLFSNPKIRESLDMFAISFLDYDFRDWICDQDFFTSSYNLSPEEEDKYFPDFLKFWLAEPNEKWVIRDGRCNTNLYAYNSLREILLVFDRA